MFKINGESWDLQFVSPNDSFLFRSDGSYTVGVTDANTHTIYIADNICGKFLKRVLAHELCHCWCISYDIYLPIEYEEILCDVLATYGNNILELADIIYKQCNCGE